MSRLAFAVAVVALLVTLFRPAQEPIPPALAVASAGVAVGTTPDTGLVPGSGYVSVSSPDRSRSARLTAYQYGSTIQTFGKRSGIFEFFLGDPGANAPELSVRDNGSGLGARVQARNSADTFGVGASARDPKRPYLGVIDESGRAPGAELVVGNPEPDGSVVISTGDPLTARLRVAADGSIDLLGDRIRLHGSKGSGLAGPDPGSLSPSADTAELVRAVNALRATLVDHGLLGARP